jgi:pyruvyltransferase
VRAVGRLPPNTIATWWFHHRTNFGDLLAPVVIEHVCGMRPLRVYGRQSGRLLTVGSVVQLSQPGDVIWGAGLISDNDFDGRGRTWLAVRGPRTRALIRGADVPPVYGDPAALLPTFFTPSRFGQRCDIGVVPHYVDRDVMRVDPDAQIQIIDPTEPDWRTTVERIASCDVIVASSLHGIVVAEAYGIPAVWVKAADQITGGAFKFHDYYASTGRAVAGPQNWSDDLRVLVKGAEEPPSMDWTPLGNAGRRWVALQASNISRPN